MHCIVENLKALQNKKITFASIRTQTRLSDNEASLEDDATAATVAAAATAAWLHLHGVVARMVEVGDDVVARVVTMVYWDGEQVRLLAPARTGWTFLSSSSFLLSYPHSCIKFEVLAASADLSKT